MRYPVKTLAYHQVAARHRGESSGHPKIHTTGSLQETSQPLDLAVNGRGFFQIAMPDGTAAYTRDGTFHMDAEGQVVNAVGYLLEPNITIPDQTNTLTISRDGIVSVTQFGRNQSN